MGEQAKGRDIAARFGCRFYESYEDLLQKETIDFAFAFGRHAEMPRIAEMLIERRIPFALEKPCGVKAAQVTRLRELAESAGVYVAVPFIFRISDFLAAIEEMEGRIPSDFNHLQFRFIVGPPSRYITAGVPWMLDPAIAGGGPTINVASHFFDLFRFITGKDIATVSAVMSSRTHGGEIEDYSIVTLRTDDGVVGVVESGYSFPSTSDEQREFSFTLGSSGHYAYSGQDAFHVRDRSNLATGTRTRPVRLETDIYYPLFVRRVLDECRAGSSPVAGLRDAEAMMEIVEAAYASARLGGAPQKITRMRRDKRNSGDLRPGTTLVAKYRHQPLTPSTPIPTHCGMDCATASRTSPTSVFAALSRCWFPVTFGRAARLRTSDGGLAVCWRAAAYASSRSISPTSTSTWAQAFRRCENTPAP
jgi:predicted dehydrogenase